ncbi:MAG: phosphoribosylanthranilate isomerase [Eubacteriales bacterium]|nr:phosphoribosylanthranilate isomerase [Eubacteriales bacterium]
MRTRLKICGLMTERDAALVNRYRPEYAGIVFAHTRHFVSDGQAARIRAALDPEIPAVGVFVDEEPEHVASLMRSETIQIAQLHGHEDAAYLEELRRLLGERGEQTNGTQEALSYRKQSAAEAGENGRPDREAETHGAAGIRIIKAVRVRSREQVMEADRLPCDALLLDAYVAGQAGGTGTRIEEGLLPELSALHHPVFLAGGITPQTAAQVAGRYRPYAIDVSSGVEYEDFEAAMRSGRDGGQGGCKDEEKLRALVRALENGAA